MFGGNWKSTGPIFPARDSGSMVLTNRARNSSVFFRRLICVMT